MTAPATGPSWCARHRSGHAACGELAEHTSRTYRANPDGDELLGARVHMTQNIIAGYDPRPILWLTVTEDGVDQAYPFMRGQARVIRHALSRLLDASRRGA